LNEYKEDRKEASKAVRAWIPFGLGLGAFVLVIVLVLIFAGLAVWGGYAIIHKAFEREIVQQSQQYTESKGALLHKLYGEYIQLDADITMLEASGGNREVINAKIAQQKELVGRIKYEASLVPDSEVPDEVRAFIATH